ncbi:ArsR/SmtB family transcription factor [Vagococcus intermedius]|uniref:Metalloregulator ArsR/SmtB family transcription factor n=1 Tax=Vagococcus intermedius TaxID=2991418 RepID=A0AAF0I890_9ENTE|nr:metalloregulator ArsR/SmtB family transcription factor [Vagococcus intermedius]WEG73934.1 metalloregulator ArsR/SmtB family transcription factor [Vagococcus intermedius]WEG76015.1 metalloregulator ArsR/SmtB family transcription factor [Vagococcus intermedius]
MPKLEASNDIIEKVSQLYKALGDPTRLKILTLLSQSEMNVSAIVTEIGLEQSAVSHQLKLLRNNHVVKSRKEGKIVYYSLDDQHVVDILGQTFQHIRHIDK